MCFLVRGFSHVAEQYADDDSCDLLSANLGSLV
jgi:hypothetical protein